ncbi:MAG: substrate-binding protein [Paenibacillaceae bacterium]|jgi:LacI family transcriptional regulator|nr:substrate-binding protein [Paenibacillaceae bacterium]
MSRSSKRLTVKEIAEQIGISPATLDRVLNNRGMVKPKTYQMVMDKIKELNYIPNKSASFLSRKQQIHMAVVFPEHPEYFWKQIETGIQTAWREFRDYGLELELVRTEKYDPEKQRQAVGQLIESGQYDAIALSPAEPLLMVDLIDRAVDAGIAVCTFNTDSPASRRLFYVGCDYRIAGRVAADMLCKLTGRGKLSVIASETNFQMQQKIAGFREVIGEHPEMEMAGPLKVTQEDYGSPELFDEYFRQVDGIYVASARLHSIAGHLARARPELAKPLPLVGHDMTEDIYRGLQDGLITATICQDPVNQGYLAVKTMFECLSAGKRSQAKEYITKLEVVTKENAHYYV